MKEIWKKTSLLYKMIALLLTAVMVGTTLYFHFDKKYVAKAEGEGDIEVFAAYIDGNANSTTYGEGGWQRVQSGIKVANGENRHFAYFIAVQTPFENLEKLYYTMDGSEPTGAVTDNVINVGSDDSSITLTGYEGYKCYKIDINFKDNKPLNVAHTYDSAALTPTGDAKFDWLETTGVVMTAKIGDMDLNGNSFDSLGKTSTMTVDIASPNELTGFTVFGEDKLSELGGLGQPTYNKQSKLYTYPTYRYNFGDNGEKTINYSNLSVSVSDGTNTQTKTASSIKYDGTKPSVTAKVGGVVLDQNKWYGTNDGNITFTVNSGDGDSESALTSVKYTINGGNAVDAGITGTTGNFTINSIPDGTNEIVVTAVDAAGNTNDSDSEKFVFKVDKSLPVANSINVEPVNEVSGIKYVKLNEQSNVVISGNVIDTPSGAHHLYIETTAPTYDNPIQDNGATATATSTEGVFPNSWNYSYNLSSTMGMTDSTMPIGTKDGTYTVKVTPVDTAGNKGTTTQTITFILDTINPDIKLVQLERYNNLSSTWETVEDSELDSSGTYFLNSGIYTKVRYKISCSDTYLIDSNPVKVYKDDIQYGSVSFDNGYYYLEVPTSELSKDSALSLVAKGEDKAGNIGTVSLTPVQLVDSDIKVNLIDIKVGDNSIATSQDNISDIGSLISDKNVNERIKIKIKAFSGFKITSVILTDGLEYTDTASFNPIEADSKGIHSTSEIEFTLPKMDNNKKLSSLKLRVVDEKGNFKDIKIGDLLYDNTDPEITITNSDYNKDKWYQDYALEFKLISGGSTVVESDLDSASYTINGNKKDINIDGTDKTVVESKTDKIPESTSVNGTTVSFEAKDKATNNMAGGAYSTFVVKVDKTAPAVSSVKVNGEEASEETVLAGVPQLTSTITDNLTVKDYSVSVKYNDEMYVEDYHVSVEKDASQESISHTLQQVLGSKELKDGKYTVSISASDKSGRTSNVSTTSFIVDNTVPVLGASIISGTTGKNNGYYNTDVVVRLTCKDNNFNPSAMTVTDNGSAINANWQVGNDIYYADVTLSAEGLHDIRVTGNDKAGTAAEAKQVTFIIDKTVPTVSLLVNGGQVYNESRGTLNLTGPLTLTASVSDTNEDAGDLRVQIVKTVPDTATSTSEFLPTGERTFSFADEADYVVNIFAVDRANNQGPTRTISFRVDTTAPQLTITGANGGTASSATSVSFNITEAFWSDAKGTVEIYRKAGDGVDEALYKILTISPTQRAYSLSELLRESGIYRFEFTADDKVGHTATASQKITVDVNKPEITLSGVNNYDSTDGAVSISAIIKDEFYASKKVSIQGTRTDAAGKKTALSFSPFAATANPTTINDTFSEEGIYDITLTATDIAGNVTSNSVHFTIDTSKPVIGDLSKYDGKTFNAKTFEELGLDINLDEIVTDLTVCQVRMYLNGSEYDGMADIEDGSYTLLITAEDELGHKSEKSATFVLDTKEPIFIVTGVEDGEIRNDNYNIEVSLQLDEDTLDEVKLNDKVITVKNNVATFDVTDKGEYELYMKATDEAGNEATQTIKFTFGEESVATAVSNAVEKAASHWWLWAIVVAAILAVCGIIFFILKRRNEE